MGNVIMKLKVMPSDVDVDLESIKERIQDETGKVEIKDFGIQPIAFGLKTLMVVAVMPDEEGIGDQFIEKIKGIDGVENVEVESLELL
ncbi:MAG TPA: elongation factor 1-beta [Archaeoglobaceae archaeon]|nr:elongation factor 1-beta [Archaeoglobaceae archaeon]